MGRSYNNEPSSIVSWKLLVCVGFSLLLFGITFPQVECLTSTTSSALANRGVHQPGRMYLLHPTRPRFGSQQQHRRSPRSMVQHRLSNTDDKNDNENDTAKKKETKTKERKKKAPKRKMLQFAIPALGIYLSNPLLSNIDNAFVGRTVGTSGLAALSPATLCIDQILYLFSFLSRATTGLVARAYAAKDDDDEAKSKNGNMDAAREAGSAPLTVSLVCGVLLAIMYAFFTPNMLSMFHVNPLLRESAASYIYWRGAISCATLAQSVALSMMMATRDSITPLKIIGLAAMFNVIGDALFCIWPLSMGCAGSAAATSGATLLSCGFMLKALKKKKLLPQIRLPTKKEMFSLLEFTGPLMAITLIRLLGYINMQSAAMNLGVKPLAAYQLSLNLFIFFLLFGEPLSQLSQTKLPALVDSHDTEGVRATLKSVLILAVFTALSVGGVAYSAITFGSGLFSSDPGVQLLAKQAAPAVFAAVVTTTFAGKWCTD